MERSKRPSSEIWKGIELLMQIRIILVSCLFSISLIGHAQFKICQENASMFSRCFQFNDDGTFSYHYFACVSMTQGKGTYQQRGKKLILQFHDMQSPRVNDTLDLSIGNDVVQISYYDAYSDEPVEFAMLKYNDSTYFTDTSGEMTIRYGGGPIIVYQYFQQDSMILYPAVDSSNCYAIKWNFPLSQCISEDTRLILKQKGSAYMLKEKKFVHNHHRSKLKWRKTHFKIVNYDPDYQ